jgi:transposase
MLTYQDLLRENSELRRRAEEQERRIAELKQRIGELEKLIEEVRRRGKRQAAPFSKGKPKDQPQPPGRKAGKAYGQPATRSRPQRVDEQIVVDCPLFCEHCQGKVVRTGQAHQYQIDLPEIRPRTTEFVLHYGKCLACGREVVGRHPRQTSQSFRVGEVQIGPGVLSFAAYLNKVGGLSYGKVAAVMSEMADLKVSRSALCRGVERLAKKLEPLYHELIDKIRGSPVVYPDETGWRIGGRSAWLWVFTNRRETVYTIQPGRGYTVAEEILGGDYEGVLGADGWAPYQRFEQATHQTCLAHLLRRCHEMLETAGGAAAKFPRSVQEVLQAALALRDRRDAGAISPQGLSIARGRLQARLSRLLSGRLRSAANRRLAQHLRRHEDQLFVFLERGDVEATNWAAEQALRPAVVNRKSSGGNRTSQGARAQSILMSALRTFQQYGLSPTTIFIKLLRSSQPLSLETLLKS